MGGHHERRSPKFALNSTFTISTTLNPATSLRYFLSKDECELLPLVSVKLGGLRTTLQLLLPSTPTTSQLTTQNKHKPQGNLNFLQTFSRGRQLGSFLVFFWKFLGEGCGPRRLESWCAVEERRQAGNGNLFPDFATCTLPGSHTWTLWRQPFYWLVTVEKVEMRAFYMSSHPAEKMQLQSKLDDFQDRGWLHWHLKFAKIWATWF